EARAVVGRVAAHLREGDLRHHRVLGERRRPHEVPDRLAVPAEARRAVREVALVLLLADREAEVRTLVDAVDARTALRREERDDVIADAERRHAVTDTFDDTRALVSQYGRRVSRRVDAGGGVEVGVADAAGDDAHEHLARARLGELEVLHDERRPELLEHGGLDPQILTRDARYLLTRHHLAE